MTPPWILTLRGCFKQDTWLPSDCPGQRWTGRGRHGHGDSGRGLQRPGRGAQRLEGPWVAEGARHLSGGTGQSQAPTPVTVHEGAARGPELRDAGAGGGAAPPSRGSLPAQELPAGSRSARPPPTPSRKQAESFRSAWAAGHLDATLPGRGVFCGRGHRLPEAHPSYRPERRRSNRPAREALRTGLPARDARGEAADPRWQRQRSPGGGGGGSPWEGRRRGLRLKLLQKGQGQVHGQRDAPGQSSKEGVRSEGQR